jgi:hypothetical protein
VSTGLYEFCVSTIVEMDQLKEFYWEGSGRIAEGKPWTQAKALLDEARENHVRMPVIFSDAAQDSETLLCWAVIEDISIKDQTTECRFSSVRRFRKNHGRQDLVLKETREHIKPMFIRPYAICRTPDFLDHESD